MLQVARSEVRKPYKVWEMAEGVVNGVLKFGTPLSLAGAVGNEQRDSRTGNHKGWFKDGLGIAWGSFPHSLLRSSRV